MISIWLLAYLVFNPKHIIFSILLLCCIEGSLFNSCGSFSFYPLKFAITLLVHVWTVCMERSFNALLFSFVLAGAFGCLLINAKITRYKFHIINVLTTTWSQYISNKNRIKKNYKQYTPSYELVFMGLKSDHMKFIRIQWRKISSKQYKMFYCTHHKYIGSVQYMSSEYSAAWYSRTYTTQHFSIEDVYSRQNSRDKWNKNEADRI